MTITPNFLDKLHALTPAQQVVVEAMTLRALRKQEEKDRNTSPEATESREIKQFQRLHLIEQRQSSDIYLNHNLVLAEQGDPEAQFEVFLIQRARQAHSLFGGPNPPIEERYGMAMLVKAAKQGHLQAQYTLGAMKMKSFLELRVGGVVGNEALEWLTQAAEGGEKRAMHHICDLLRNWSARSRSPSDPRINPTWGVRALAVLKHEAESTRDHGLQHDLSLILLAPRSEPINQLLQDIGTVESNTDELAVELLMQAARNGNPHAMNQVALSFNSGYNGMPKDPRQAFVWHAMSMLHSNRDLPSPLEALQDRMGPEKSAQALEMLHDLVQDIEQERVGRQEADNQARTQAEGVTAP